MGTIVAQLVIFLGVGVAGYFFSNSSHIPVHCWAGPVFGDANLARTQVFLGG
jgi:hypothetical protein